jgi:hypothetical protein
MTPARNRLSPAMDGRRRYETLPLRLTCRLTRADRPEVVHCVTENISAEEVCILSPELIPQGELLDADLLLPACNAGGDCFRTHLKYRVEVLRVELAQRGGFIISGRVDGHTIGLAETNHILA